METMTIELTNQKAAALLHELEELQLIRIINQQSEEVKEENLSEKYWGILAPAQGADLHQHIKDMRNEWDRSI